MREADPAEWLLPHGTEIGVVLLDGKGLPLADARTVPLGIEADE